jgi:hypothetical protein
MNIASSPSQPLIVPTSQLTNAALNNQQASQNAGTVFKPVHETQSVDKSLSSKQTKPTQAYSQNNQENTNTESAAEKNDIALNEQKRKLDKLEAKKEQIQQQEIQELSARDREVRNHERAHAAVGGQYAGAPRYQYERGPDGVNYAVAGEVPISTGAISGNPQATIEKAQVIRRAALAPAEPSPQDRRIAAEATQMESQARVELAELQREKRIEASDSQGANENVAGDSASQIEASPSVANASVEETTNQQVASEQTPVNPLVKQLNQSIINSRIGEEIDEPGRLLSRMV